MKNLKLEGVSVYI